jgi:kynurenine formamidase
MITDFNFTFDNKKYSFNSAKPIDISIPLDAGENRVNCYYAEPIKIETISFGETFVGSVAKGGACNYQKVSLTPHGNGTHTECYGHISKEKVTINQCLNQFHFLATLVSISPSKLPNGDEVILLKDIQEKLGNSKCNTLIIRTLPNNQSKKTHQYSNTNPPYLEPSVGKFLAERGIEHLLLDLPSVDRESDEGVLSVHHGFWNYPKSPRKHCTITELIYVPNTLEDGDYLLNLQIISLEMDASPSKPILYRISECV